MFFVVGVTSNDELPGGGGGGGVSVCLTGQPAEGEATTRNPMVMDSHTPH